MGGSPSAKVEIRLRGAGAPAEAITGRVDRRGRYRCDGVGHAKSHRSRYHKKKGCSFDAAGLAAGTYRVALTVDGRELHEHSFDVVALPTAGGEKRLSVDPGHRTKTAYMDGLDLVVWVPVDARRRGRLVSVHWFHDGKALPMKRFDPRRIRPGAETFVIKGPSLVEGDALLRAEPVKVRRPRRGAWDRPDYSGKWTVLVLADDNQRIGAWEFSQRGDRDAARIDGVAYGRGVMAWGPVSAARDVSPDLWRQTTLLARRRLREISTMRFAGGLKAVFRGYPEQVVCAVAQNPRAYKLLRSQASVASEMNRLAWGFQGANEVLASRYSTRAQRGQARAKRRATIRGAAGAGKVARRLRRKMRSFARRHKPGCLKRLLQRSES